MAISLTKQLRQGKGTNNEAIQDVYCIAPPSTSYKSTPGASTDPFSGKTNKYAESKIISVTTITKAIHIKFGASDLTAADTNDYLIPADTTQYFLVDDAKPYVRIIENAATAVVVITELY